MISPEEATCLPLCSMLRTAAILLVLLLIGLIVMLCKIGVLCDIRRQKTLMRMHLQALKDSNERSMAALQSEVTRLATGLEEVCLFFELVLMEWTLDSKLHVVQTAYYFRWQDHRNGP